MKERVLLPAPVSKNTANIQNTIVFAKTGLKPRLNKNIHVKRLTTFKWRTSQSSISFFSRFYRTDFTVAPQNWFRPFFQIHAIFPLSQSFVV